MAEQGTSAAGSAQESTASVWGGASRSILNPDVGDHKRSEKPRRVRKGASQHTHTHTHFASK